MLDRHPNRLEQDRFGQLGDAGKKPMMDALTGHGSHAQQPLPVGVHVPQPILQGVAQAARQGEPVLAGGEELLGKERVPARTSQERVDHLGLGILAGDAGQLLGQLVAPEGAELDIVESNPFASIDQKGVGRLMEITRDLGRKARPNIKLGICGEHGGEPASVKFCHRLGLDYVSCSPFRIPIARLAAAQAALES